MVQGFRGSRWYLGAMRHAHVQHAQQSAPCHVFVGSHLCTHRFAAQDFPVTSKSRLSRLCPARVSMTVSRALVSLRSAKAKFVAPGPVL